MILRRDLSSLLQDKVRCKKKKKKKNTTKTTKTHLAFLLQLYLLLNAPFTPWKSYKVSGSNNDPDLFEKADTITFYSLCKLFLSCSLGLFSKLFVTWTDSGL